MDWFPGWRRPDFLKSKRGRNRVEDGNADEEGLVDDMFPGFKMTEEDAMLARQAYSGTGADRKHGVREKGVQWGYMFPMLEALTEDRRRKGLGMKIKVLDVGCGAGNLAIDLAKRLGDAGEVVGVDLSGAVLETARAKAEMEKMDNVRFLKGDVYSLPFGEGEFDVVCTHQVLAHCGEYVRAIKELIRVARKGSGVLCSREGDLLTARFFPEDEVLEECFDVIRKVHASTGGAVDAGRKSKEWILEVGVKRKNVEVSYRAWVHETAEERREYGGHWPARCTQGIFADKAMELGVARERLEEYALAWKRWVGEPRARFVMIHGEVIAGL